MRRGEAGGSDEVAAAFVGGRAELELTARQHDRKLAAAAMEKVVAGGRSRGHGLNTLGRRGRHGRS